MFEPLGGGCKGGKGGLEGMFVSVFDGWEAVGAEDWLEPELMEF